MKSQDAKWVYLGVWLWLFFKVLFMPKCIKMIFFFIFLQIIFKISILKQSKKYKKKLIFLKTRVLPHFQTLSVTNAIIGNFVSQTQLSTPCWNHEHFYTRTWNPNTILDSWDNSSFQAGNNNILLEWSFFIESLVRILIK